MIIITSSGEFSFIILFSILQSVFFFFLFHFTVKKKKKELTPLGRIVSLLSCVCPVLAVGVHRPMDEKSITQVDHSQYSTGA